MGYENVIELLESSTDLPTMPAVAQQLLAISEWEDVELKDVADLIVKDVALTAKILRLVNSSYYGFPGEVQTMTQALTILGIRATRSLTLSFSLLELMPDKDSEQFDYEAFWTRSLNTATAARQLAIATLVC